LKWKSGLLQPLDGTDYLIELLNEKQC
jgi:hypothetical protein